jgi:hypothetical protein
VGGFGDNGLQRCLTELCVLRSSPTIDFRDGMSLEKVDEILGTEDCNTHIQPLQHMQHPDLLL